MQTKLNDKADKAIAQRELDGLLTMLILRGAAPQPVMDKIDGRILALTVKLDLTA
jgi:hypothetical protein